MSNSIQRYLVKHQDPLSLAEIDPRSKDLYPDLDKESSAPIFDGILEEMKLWQHRLFAENSRALLVAVQAMDCGGKDGTARHVFGKLDPQGVAVYAFKRPNDEELAHDFLWRIHRRVPRRGQIGIFNRTHYEDIIAVKVKKLFADQVWQRRYRSIEDFEHLLVSEGTQVIKIFLHISKKEQQQRLQARLDDPTKHWKFEFGDLEDRQRWDQFQTAYEEMISRTSFDFAPWYVVPADRKWYRNLVVGKIVNHHLAQLNPQFPKPDFDPEKVQVSD